jgi:hypothetical protein
MDVACAGINGGLRFANSLCGLQHNDRHSPMRNCASEDATFGAGLK